MSGDAVACGDGAGGSGCERQPFARQADRLKVNGSVVDRSYLPCMSETIKTSFDHELNARAILTLIDGRLLRRISLRLPSSVFESLWVEYLIFGPC